MPESEDGQDLLRRVLIVDDRPSDRRSLRHALARLLPTATITEAEDVHGMYRELARGCDLLFQDVALEPTSEEPDSRGLDAIYDILEAYPHLPIIIVTGYFADKAKEVLRCVFGQPALVDLLDKLEYDTGMLESAIEAARQFRDKAEYERTRRDFVEEVFEEAERRVQGQIAQVEAKLAREAATRVRWEQAFVGEDWHARIDAEAELFGGQCNKNSLELARLLDCLAREKSAGRPEGGKTLYDRIVWIRELHDLQSYDVKRLLRTKTVRNRIVHGERNATQKDALELAWAVEFLSGLRLGGVG